MHDSATARLRLNHFHQNGTNSINSAGGLLPLNQFNHVALVWDSTAGEDGTMRGYVNGALAFEMQGKDYWNDEPACGWNFMVGGRNLVDNEWGFIGNIDEVRWSSYALSPSQFLCAAKN